MRSVAQPRVPLLHRGAAVLVALACLLPGAAVAPPAHAEDPSDSAEVVLDGWWSQDSIPELELETPSPFEEDTAVPGVFLVTSEGAAGAALLDRLPAAAGARAVAAAGEALDGALAEVLADGVTRVSVDPGADAEAVGAALAVLPGVVAVEPERRWEFSNRTPNDPLYGQQWAHRQADAPRGWAVTTGGRARRIAIVDSGIDGRHPDLPPIQHRYVISRTAGGGLTLRSGPLDNDTCSAGHGTAVAGVAAASGNNGRGVTGVAWDAELVDIAVIAAGDCGITDSKVIRALKHVASGAVPGGRVDVVNLSLGGIEVSGRCPTALQTAIDEVVASGTVVVAAAGNYGTIDYAVPAGCRGVIAVGATDHTDNRAGYSSMARHLDVVAPGGAERCAPDHAARCILTTTRARSYTAQTGYGSITGTSFAAPYVSGLVALVRELRPTLSPAQVEAVLETTARHPRAAGRHDHEHGWGVVDVGRALEHVRANRPIAQPARHPALRIAAGPATDPVHQAVAVSRVSFRDHLAGGLGRTASFAVLARQDDFADALAGSSLAYGAAPLLFARRDGLPKATADELRRTLEPRDTVYLLGGVAALDQTVERQIAALGFKPARLGGTGRAETAVVVAREVTRRLGRNSQTPTPAVLLATAFNWPDAVAAGSMGAAFGLPILLTNRAELHDATRQYLQELARSGHRPRVYVVGGTGVVADATAHAAAAAATPSGWSKATLRRLAGGSRDGTADAVAQEMRRELGSDRPPYAIAVDIDRPDSYAHALSASVLAGSTFSVFVPVRGAVPSRGLPARLSATTAAAFCRWGGDALLAGGPDLLPEAVGDDVGAVLSGSGNRC